MFDNLDYYDPMPYNVKENADSLDALEEFDEYIGEIKEDKPREPYRYGSYYFNKLDTTNQQYEVVTLANITSQDAVGEFSGFLYSALLK